MKKLNKWQCLVLLEMLFVAVALVLSVVSSFTAYAMSGLPIILAAGILTIVVDIAAIVLGNKMPSTLIDAGFLAAAVAIGLALCTSIRDRILLIGYIYFSDLESNNPVAVMAMNLAIAAYVFYLLAVIVNCTIGFGKRNLNVH